MMNFIESYVKEVGRRLPSKQRADVEAELRSLLADMVEDRAQTKLELADEALIVEVLRDFGSPKTVAESYQPSPQYLIGPALLPIFKIVVTVVTAVLIGITLVNAFLSVRTSPSFFLEVTQVIIAALPDLASQFLSAFGQITLIFIVLERIIPEEDLAEVHLGEEESWDPRQLATLVAEEPIKLAEQVASIVATALFLSLLNFFPQWAGFIYFDADETAVIPILAANLFTYLLPWINLLGLLSIGFNLVKLRLGRRTRLVRWGEIGMGLLTAVFLGFVITQQPLLAINPTATYSGDALTFVGGLKELITLLNTLIRISLPLLLLLTLWQTGQQLYQLWRTNDNTPTPQPA